MLPQIPTSVRTLGTCVQIGTSLTFIDFHWSIRDKAASLRGKLLSAQRLWIRCCIASDSKESTLPSCLELPWLQALSPYDLSQQRDAKGTNGFQEASLGWRTLTLIFSACHSFPRCVLFNRHGFHKEVIISQRFTKQLKLAPLSNINLETSGLAQSLNQFTILGSLV